MVRQSLFFIVFLYINWLGNISPSQGQVLDTLYYNEYWQLVSQDSAKQYRIAEIDTINLWFTGKFHDYYMDGSLLMEGQYSKSGLKNGPFKIYFSNGQIYCNGFFDNDLLTGIWEYYNSKGKLSEKVEFSGYDFIILESYNLEGKRIVRNGTGKWVKSFTGNDGKRLEATGRYFNKKREGSWRVKNEEGKTVLIEVYSNDYFIEGTTFIPQSGLYFESKFTSELFYPTNLRTIESFTVWQANRSDYHYLNWLPSPNDSTQTQDIVIEQPDQQAYFPLGLESFYNKVAKILIYPEPAKIQNIQGKVYVEFVVGTDGFLYDTRVLRGIGGGCDQQAVIAILAAGRWFPAQKNGFPMEQRVVIPISFRLTQ